MMVSLSILCVLSVVAVTQATLDRSHDTSATHPVTPPPRQLYVYETTVQEPTDPSDYDYVYEEHNTTFSVHEDTAQETTDSRDDNRGYNELNTTPSARKDTVPETTNSNEDDGDYDGHNTTPSAHNDTVPEPTLPSAVTNKSLVNNDDLSTSMVCPIANMHAIAMVSWYLCVNPPICDRLCVVHHRNRGISTAKERYIGHGLESSISWKLDPKDPCMRYIRSSSTNLNLSSATQQNGCDDERVFMCRHAAHVGHKNKSWLFHVKNCIVDMHEGEKLNVSMLSNRMAALATPGLFVTTFTLWGVAVLLL